jgi:ATP-binding cassette subfamily F protein 3
MEAPDGDERSAVLSFSIKRQSGNDVLSGSDLAIGYEEPIAQQLRFQLQRGESVALVGPNGVGKSTLLKVLTKQQPALTGDIRYGTGVEIGYYDQEQQNLSDANRVIDEIWNDWPLMREQEVRSLLGQFLFSGDDVMKRVHELSGGERARLTLAKLKLEQPNLLILDEPTNHLDLDSKMILENALVDYPGTILFVSHDRYFIDRLATRVLEITPNGIDEYLGDYSYYVEKKEELEELARLAREETKQVIVKKQRADKEQQREERRMKQRIEEIELTIEQHEARLEEIEQLLCEPDVFNDFARAQELSTESDATKESITALYAEWEELHS